MADPTTHWPVRAMFSRWGKARFIRRCTSWNRTAGSARNGLSAKNSRRAKYYTLTKAGKLWKMKRRSGSACPRRFLIVRTGAMRLPAILYLRLRSLLFCRRVEDELDEELRYHLERQLPGR